MFRALKQLAGNPFARTLAIVGVLGVLLLIAPVVLGYVEGHWLPTLSERLGEAMIIAVLLALSVDTYMKARLTQDVLRNLSSYLMAAGAPPRMRDEVDYLCRTRVVRRNLHASFAFEETSNGKLVLSCRTTYEVENFSDEPQAFKHRAVVDIVPGEPDADQGLFNFGARGVLVKGGVTSYDFPRPKTTGVGHFEVLFEQEVDIPPSSRGIKSEFWHETKQIKTFNDSDSYFSSYPTIRKSVEVRAKPAWLEVMVAIPHRHEEQKEDPPTEPTRWVNEGAWAPYSAIDISWRRKVIVEPQPEEAPPPPISLSVPPPGEGVA